MIAAIKKHRPAQINIEILGQIASILQGIRFGSIEIVIHDSKVVLIVRKEKLRFDANK